MLEVTRDLSKPSKSYLATSVLIEYFHEIMGHGKRRAANALALTPEEYIFKGKFEKFNEGKEAGKIMLYTNLMNSTASKLNDMVIGIEFPKGITPWAVI